MKFGTSAAESYEKEHSSEDKRISPLLDALQRLYVLLSVQNRELAEANNNLEDKIKERTHALEEAGKQLLQSEKLASLGRMVAGFAHEINTPVGIALSAISQNEETLKDLNAMLSQEEVSEDEFASHLDTLRQTDKLAVSNLRRAADLVRSFKRTSIDQSSDQASNFKMHELINDVLTTLNNQFKRTNINIVNNCPGNIVIHGVPGVFQQLLTNLLLNSLQHGFNEGAQGGNINIKASKSKDGQLTFYYDDDGAGMTSEVKERIFEPFFTTSRGKGGSGLGMYVCYNIVTAQLGGTVTLNTAPGKGSHFEISLPIKPQLSESFNP